MTMLYQYHNPNSQNSLNIQDETSYQQQYPGDLRCTGVLHRPLTVSFETLISILSENKQVMKFSSDIHKDILNLSLQATLFTQKDIDPCSIDRSNTVIHSPKTKQRNPHISSLMIVITILSLLGDEHNTSALASLKSLFYFFPIYDYIIVILLQILASPYVLHASQILLKKKHTGSQLCDIAALTDNHSRHSLLELCSSHFPVFYSSLNLNEKKMHDISSNKDNTNSYASKNEIYKTKSNMTTLPTNKHFGMDNNSNESNNKNELLKNSTSQTLHTTTTSSRSSSSSSLSSSQLVKDNDTSTHYSDSATFSDQGSVRIRAGRILGAAAEYFTDEGIYFVLLILQLKNHLITPPSVPGYPATSLDTLPTGLISSTQSSSTIKVDNPLLSSKET